MNIEELIKYIFNNEIIIGTIVVVVILIKIIFLVALGIRADIPHSLGVQKVD